MFVYLCMCVCVRVCVQAIVGDLVKGAELRLTLQTALPETINPRILFSGNKTRRDRENNGMREGKETLKREREGWREGRGGGRWGGRRE